MAELAGPTELVVIAHNMRSAYNVGALLRTADVFAVRTVYCTGYTPYPRQERDFRSPALISRLGHKIHKSALGAEDTVPCLHHPGVPALLSELRASGFAIAGLEIDDRAISIGDFEPPERLALLLGEEVDGIPAKLRTACDTLLRIPMFGTKDSLNVSVASGIALYSLRGG